MKEKIWYKKYEFRIRISMAYDVKYYCDLSGRNLINIFLKGKHSSYVYIHLAKPNIPSFFSSLVLLAPFLTSNFFKLESYAKGTHLFKIN